MFFFLCCHLYRRMHILSQFYKNNSHYFLLYYQIMYFNSRVVIGPFYLKSSVERFCKLINWKLAPQIFGMQLCLMGASSHHMSIIESLKAKMWWLLDRTLYWQGYLKLVHRVFPLWSITLYEVTLFAWFDSFADLINLWTQVRLDIASLLGLLAFFVNYKFENILSSPYVFCLSIF